MAQFAKQLHSNKHAACERIARHISRAAVAMGLWPWIDESALSASHYVYVATDKDADDQIKVRVSDHADRYGGSDIYAWHDECVSTAIAELAEHFGRAIPAGYRAEDYARRSAAVRAVATKRRQARRDAEERIVAEVKAEMLASGAASAVAAGRIIDAMHPTIPRAQRQRIAYAASYAARVAGEIAAARGDENQLRDLAATYDEAKAALVEMVGPDRFRALRPAGYPRSLWTV